MTKIDINDGCIILPKTMKTKSLKVKLPQNYESKNIRKITIRPMYGYTHWQMIIEYIVNPKKHANLVSDNALGIDFGLSNLATCATNKGDSFIIDGKYLKSILQGYCKYRNKLLQANGGQRNTKRIISLHKKTQNRVNDYVRRSVNYIIRYCIENNIGLVVIGWSNCFNEFGLAYNAQLLTMFPFASFKKLLKSKCDEHGILFRIVNECYTSQASFIDNDPMPKSLTKCKQQFSGKRKSRGMYITKDGRKINADVNGAFNILRKYNAKIMFDYGARGLTYPKRINPIK